LSETLKQWVSPAKDLKTGFGYNEKLLRCEKNIVVQAFLVFDFLVLNLQFGKTVGVTESFGLFQKRMNALHNEHIKFIKQDLYKTDYIFKLVYYPVPNSVGNESYRRILKSYAEKWTETTKTSEKTMIIQSPYFEEEEIGEFSVIPYVQGINEEWERWENGISMWNVPSALETISKHFKSVILTHGK